MKNIAFLSLLLMAHTPLFAEPNALSVAQRLDRLERIVQNQNASDLLLQVQRLQREVQQLRGELEVQNHTIDGLKRRQRELYMDLDRRISEAGTNAAGPPAGEPPVAVASVPAAAAAKPAAKPVDTAKEQAAYQQAFEMLKQGNYPESIGAFRAFLQDYPYSGYADNAQYWLGEASYVTREFDTAMSEFNKVLNDYPNSGKAPGAMLKIGYIHYEKRDWAACRKILGRLQKDYPRSTEARLAEQRLQRMRQEGH
jgi:tol-pal system protein YbgF